MTALTISPAAQVLLETLSGPQRLAVAKACYPNLDAAVTEVRARPGAIKKYRLELAAEIIATLSKRDAEVLQAIVVADSRGAIARMVMSHPAGGLVTASQRKTRARIDNFYATDASLASKISYALGEGSPTWIFCEWMSTLSGDALATLAHAIGNAQASPLYSDVAQQLTSRPPASLTVDDWCALYAIDFSFVEGSIASALSGPISGALAQLMVDTDESFWPDAFMNLAEYGELTLTKEAASVFARSSYVWPHALLLAANHITAAQVSALFASRPIDDMVFLVMYARDQKVTEKILALLASSPDIAGYESDTSELLALLRRFPKLSTRARHTLLCLSDYDELTRYLQGDYGRVTKVTGAYLARLLATNSTDVSIGEVINSVLYCHKLTTASREFLRVTLPVEPGIVNDLLHPRAHGGQFASQHLASAFGKDTAKWHVALTLIPTWKGSLAGLVDAVNVTRD